MDDSTNDLKPPSVTGRLISLIVQMPENQQETLLKELEDRMSMERRRHPRRPFSTLADFVSEGRNHREFTRDISEGGVFIETSTPFSVGKEVVMTFAFADSSKPLRAAGRILRVEDAGIGIQFKIDSFLETLSIRSFLRDMDLADGQA